MDVRLDLVGIVTRDMRASLTFYRRLGLDLPSGDEPRTRDHREHHELVELITAGDAAGARELMRAHIERSLTAGAITVLEHREHDRAGLVPEAG